MSASRLKRGSKKEIRSVRIITGFRLLQSFGARGKIYPRNSERILSRADPVRLRRSRPKFPKLKY